MDIYAILPRMLLNLSSELTLLELESGSLSIPVFVDNFLVASAQWIAGTKGGFHLVDGSYEPYTPPIRAVRTPLQRGESGLEIHFLSEPSPQRMEG